MLFRYKQITYDMFLNKIGHYRLPPVRNMFFRPSHQIRVRITSSPTEREPPFSHVCFCNFTASSPNRIALKSRPDLHNMYIPIIIHVQHIFVYRYICMCMCINIFGSCYATNQSEGRLVYDDVEKVGRPKISANIDKQTNQLFEV